MAHPPKLPRMKGTGRGTGRAGSRSQGMHRSRGRRRSNEVQGNAWKRFLHDVRDVKERYLKQTSSVHKRFVLVLVVIGAALRVWLAASPITAAEAIAYMDYALRPVGETLSDYSLPVNHIFHTLLTKWSTAIFGTSPVALRLPALIASVVVLPLFYLFVRSMFNRYIALMALALTAASPCLMELSALAHGYSLSWLCLVMALIFGRHLVRENNAVSAVLLGFSCALGMWAVPSSFTAAIMVVLWVLFSVLTKYDRSVSERVAMIGLALLVFIGATLLLYLPVVMSHGLDQLFHHATEEERTWKVFSTTYADKVMEFWLWIVDPTTWWVAVLGFAGLVQAAYVSAKYRTMIIALALGAIPIALIQADAGEPWQWGYSLFFFHLGMAVALFYLLKFVQDKLIASFGKRSRTAWVSLLLVPAFALPGLPVVEERVDHLPEAGACADILAKAMVEGDGLCTDATWRAPVDMALLSAGLDPRDLHRTPASGHMLYTIVAANTTGFHMALLHCKERPEHYDAPLLVKEWERMETFAARYNGER